MVSFFFNCQFQSTLQIIDYYISGQFMALDRIIK